MYGAHEWPELFQDDWLNQAMGSAYKFVPHFEPKGTSIAHADVLRRPLVNQRLWAETLAPHSS
jgi:hypothetical protein